MEIFNKITHKISEWNTARNEKRININRDKGTCPDCSGKGFDPMIYSGGTFIDPNFVYCPSCNGTGSFSDWAETTHTS